jgi:hypothetical protein
MNHIRRLKMRTEVRYQPGGQVLTSGVRGVNKSELVEGCTPITAEAVIARLEDAGATLLAMPSRGYTTHMRQMRFDIVHTALEAYGWEAPVLRAPVPSAAAISAMDEAFAWLRLIPEESYVLRRIVGARALVHPITKQHLYSWRRLAATLGADHKSVQRWHGAGVATMVETLRRQIPGR